MASPGLSRPLLILNNTEKNAIYTKYIKYSKYTKYIKMSKYTQITKYELFIVLRVELFRFVFENVEKVEMFEIDFGVLGVFFIIH